jgi:hypothetical protein
MKIKTIIATGAVSLALVACVTNPITGRKSVQIVGNDQLILQWECKNIKLRFLKLKSSPILLMQKK